jgi:DNA-binding CsgD family transcriptional regulator
MIAEQKTSKVIGEELFISEKTVRNHRYNISKKLNLDTNNNSLLKWAIANFSK